MKAAIVTISGNKNYGNRLQNYALQHFLENMNIITHTIWDESSWDHVPLSWRVFLKKNGLIKGLIKLLIDYKCCRSSLPDELKRQESFLAFNKKYIKFSDVKAYYNKIPDSVTSMYDYFIVGSDQVWNPCFKCTGLEFLTFAPKEKRISYAASFGISTLPLEFHEQFTKWLNGMTAISVREYTGADIVHELTGRKAEVLADPTLLLTAGEWKQIARKPVWYKDEDYILLYFLGPIPDEAAMIIKKIANENNLKIIDILDRNNLQYYCSAPDEFIYLVEHARLIYTDSFHGTVFSILMQVPFVSCDRVSVGVPSMISRIETLLNTFSLQDRKGTRENGYQIEDVFDINFSTCEDILEVERTRAKSFLTAVLNL
ncbi:polysaccharide pyruvyl transferase family protein [Anaerospora hongkongensis]|uniref:polysaccharide pyruvyl transferase family protein n=1 Tax=Anaerospora hongkongensis TaxID=244830 RepID=UPI0028A011B6|nr:polysaccharide pyruvyl transferase family protein [Anaerospora hongkongensis]